MKKENHRNVLYSSDTELLIKACKIMTKHELPSKRVFHSEDGLTLEFEGFLNGKNKPHTKISLIQFNNKSLLYDSSENKKMDEIKKLIEEHSFKEER